MNLLQSTYLALLIGCTFSQAARPSPRPNFVIINIDDLGYADIGPFGSKLNRTPNLDRMAAEGMKLRCHYAAPVCSPSRTALMTGCYPKRVLPIPSVLFPSAAIGLNPEETTVAEMLHDAGYATMCVGKWHLGDQPEFLPMAQGFDHYFGLPYSNDMGTAAEGSKSNLGDPLPQLKGSPTGAANDLQEIGLLGNQQPPLPLVRDHKVIERVGQDGQQSLVQRYTEEALNFIRSSKDKSFFLYLPHTAVHFPLYPGRAFKDKSTNGLYGDWVEEVDWGVGQLLDGLRELGLDKNTLVIFTSDNGGTPRAVNTPLRGFKASTWEGGMRVPTIAWWPGKVPAGTSTDAITSMTDVLPTFAALSGGKLPQQRIDGGDIWPILSGQAYAKSPHADLFYFYRGLKLEAVRSGDWKLILASAGQQGNAAKGGKKGEGKKASQPTKLQLYNLNSDIGESKDVATENPDVVARLQALVDKAKDDLGVDGIGPGCRALGRVEHPQPLMSADGTVREGFKP